MIGGIETLAVQPVETIKTVEPPAKLADIDGKDLRNNIEFPDGKGNGLIEKPDIAFIERTSRMALIEQNLSVSIERNSVNSEPSENIDRKGLTEDVKAKVKEETGWSDEIVDAIQNMKQYEILKNADLKKAEINGRKCLIKENIDLDYTDADGITNRQQMERGLAPLDNNGDKIYLHHLGQKADSPLVELTYAEHMQNGNDTIWHDKNIETEVHGYNEYAWTKGRESHWAARVEQIIGGNN